jgi:hypothetical protein
MAFRQRFVTSYLDPLAVETEFKSYPGKYPGLCTLEELPLATHGYTGVHTPAHGPRKMYLLRISSSNGPATKPAVLLMRSPHAREWINGIAVVEAALEFLENYRADDPDPLVQQIVTTLDSAEILIVPEGNPDGALYSFFDPGQLMWRKNLRPPPSGGSCAGVDCNRNFSRYFGEAGSSSVQCSDVYHGPQAFSEPESANIANLVNGRRNIIFAIDSHSYGQAIYRPNPNGGTYISSLPVPLADHAIYTRLEQLMNERIQSVNGAVYSTGSTSNHAGTSDEYLFFEQNVFGFDLECGQDFQPPVEDALTASLEVAAATRALAWCASGHTDVNIQSLLDRRMALDARETISARPARKSWTPIELPPERWRRFICTCRPPGGRNVISYASDLQERAFDIASDDLIGPELELILSAEELVSLLREGAHIEVFKDAYAEK